MPPTKAEVMAALESWKWITYCGAVAKENIHVMAEDELRGHRNQSWQYGLINFRIKLWNTMEI